MITIESHGQPRSRAYRGRVAVHRSQPARLPVPRTAALVRVYWRHSRCPARAASAHVRASHGQPRLQKLNTHYNKLNVRGDTSKEGSELSLLHEQLNSNIFDDNDQENETSSEQSNILQVMQLSWNTAVDGRQPFNLFRKYNKKIHTLNGRAVKTRV